MRAPTLAAALSALLVWSAAADVPPHGEGAAEVTYGRMDTTTKAKVKVQGQEIMQSQAQTVYGRWTDLGPDAKGNRRYRYRIEAVKVSMGMASHTTEYDSTASPKAGAPADPLAEFFAALVGVELTATLDPKTGEVVAVEGRDELVKRLVEKVPTQKFIIEQVLNEEAVKLLVHPAGGVRVPPGAGAGAKWGDRRRIDFGPVGSFDQKSEYTVAGPAPRNPRLLQIDVLPAVTYRPPEKADPALGFRFKAGDLKSGKETSGRVLYEPGARRVVRVETVLMLSGKLTVEVSGSELDLEIEQEQRTLIEFALKPLLP